MAEIKSAAISIIFTFTLFSIMASSLYLSSTDPMARPLQNYSTGAAQANFTSINSGNFTADSGNPMTNMKTIIDNMNQEIVRAQANAQGGGINYLLSAFGLLAAITIALGQLLLGVFINGFNLIAALQTNIFQIPSPWNQMAFTIEALVAGTFIILIGFAIADWIAGRRT